MIWKCLLGIKERAEALAQKTETGEGDSMKAIVVYESHWGNTAAIARAIAEGSGRRRAPFRPRRPPARRLRAPT